jgi:hypothetical protein
VSESTVVSPRCATSGSKGEDGMTAMAVFYTCTSMEKLSEGMTRSNVTVKMN